MRLVSHQFKILVAEAEDIFNVGIEPHLWWRQGFPFQLLVGLLQVVKVQVGVTQGVDEFARFQAGDLGHHQGEQGVGGNVEEFSDIRVLRQIASGDSDVRYHNKRLI